MNRRRPGQRSRKPNRFDERCVLSAGDLVRIAIMTEDSELPDKLPVAIMADGTSESVSHRQAAQIMTVLALIARGFAINLPEGRHAELLLELERLMVDIHVERIEAALTGWEG